MSDTRVCLWLPITLTVALFCLSGQGIETCETRRPQEPPSGGAYCQDTFHPKQNTIKLSDKNHHYLCQPVRLRDVAGKPQKETSKIQVRVDVLLAPPGEGYKTQGKHLILAEVKDFKKALNQEGHVIDEALYVGMLPISSEDEKYVFSINVETKGYLPISSAPIQFCKPDKAVTGIPVLTPYEPHLVRDLKNWRPKFDDTAPDWFQEAVHRLTPGASDPMVKFLTLKENGKIDSIPLSDFQVPKTSTKTSENPEFWLAKASLRNMLYKLYHEGDAMVKAGSHDWRPHLKSIVAVGQERVIFEVDGDALKQVKALIRDPNRHGCAAYHDAPSSLHSSNFTRVLDGKVKKAIDLVSVKSPVCQGNLQVTVAEYEIEGKGIQSLGDFDFDDNFATLAHSGDVLSHWLTGKGTNPLLIYEYLTELDPTAPLGYHPAAVHIN